MLLFFFQYSQALHATLFLSVFPGSACYSFSFSIPRLCMLLFFFQYSQALHATLFLSIFPGSACYSFSSVFHALHATLFLSIFPGSACYSFSFNIPRLCMLLFFFQYSQALHATLFLSVFPGSACYSFSFNIPRLSSTEWWCFLNLQQKTNKQMLLLVCPVVSTELLLEYW